MKKIKNENIKKEENSMIRNIAIFCSAYNSSFSKSW